MGFFTRIPNAFRRVDVPWSAPPTTVSVGLPRQYTAVRSGLRTSSAPVNPPTSALTLRCVYSSASATGASANNGRVVISGRLADVCAEIDRLVAMETQRSLH
jgi:hypothetical protein